VEKNLISDKHPNEKQLPDFAPFRAGGKQNQQRTSTENQITTKFLSTLEP